MKAASVMDYRTLARRRLPAFLFNYIDGGSFDEVTLKRNRRDLQDLALRQRVLCDVSKIDVATTLFGEAIAIPVVLAPVGLGGMNARRGEIQAARAAQNAGAPFTLSTVSLCSLEEVSAATQRPFWFQLYMLRDKPFMRDMLARARAAGCTTLVFTVDLPTPGVRYRDYRTGLSNAANWSGRLRRTFQSVTHPRWAWDVGVMGRPHRLGNLSAVLGKADGIENYMAWLSDNFDPSVTWKDLEWIRDSWRGTLIIKGVLDPDDARLAADSGADGIVVSNHGGRQLDGALSTAAALPAIADAVGERLTVLADGGVRSGLDVVRMLALGAKSVMIGRAWAYALAGGGEAGVAHVLRIIEAEIRVAMALTGVTRAADIGRDLLA